MGRNSPTDDTHLPRPSPAQSDHLVTETEETTPTATDERVESDPNTDARHLFADPQPTERGCLRHAYEPTDDGERFSRVCSDEDSLEEPETLAYEPRQVFMASGDACPECRQTLDSTSALPELNNIN